MPADPPSNTGSPDRSRPTAADLSKETTEGDLWNLDDEPVENLPTKPAPPPAAGSRAAPAESAGRKAIQRSEPQGAARKAAPAKDESPSAASHDEIGDLDETPGEDQEEAVLLVLEDEPQSAPAAQLPREEAPAPPAEAAPRQNRPRPAPAPPPTTLSLPKLSSREIIGLGAFGFFIALAAIWVITRFFTQVPFQDSYLAAPDYPVRGQHAVIIAAETFWREPVREGANRDSAKREVMMIPVVEITFDPNSSAGALWIIFKNQDGEIIGDPLIRSFTPAGAKLAVAATDGFVSEGDYNAYRTSDKHPWTVEVREGPSADGGSASFKPLTVIPISPLRR
ncbi:hypothetical protein OJ996_21120 [Luteolibacter sp. GHJ8]|uniref:Anti-sigma-K factor rskA n=1 Tax=Luteolibacter rhizosphaerae TaxID=2989719 RepID=A0ABT3G927_9BACT|nr:hypothetical protein [Luteolibacter rhizosphaerae]MCW1916104.1 hypothetical protein [Luteolibacter rhizosphaerae]